MNLPIEARPRSVLAVSLLVAAIGTGAQAQERSAAPETFYGRSQVTLVEVAVEVRDAAGDVPASVTAADLEVLEDGEPVEVIGVERLAGARAAGAEEGP